MSKKSQLIFFYTWSVLTLSLHGQKLERKKVIWPRDSTIYFDSVQVYPSSIRLKPNLPYHYDLSSNMLKLRQAYPDSITVYYIPFSSDFSGKTQSRYRQYLINDLQYDNQIQVDAKKTNKDSQKLSKLLPEQEELYRTGSIVRGISVGNTQSLFTNSNLDLYVEGKLTKKLNISASITDRNIPFEPEGNTQRIQDFDNVLISVFNDQTNLQVGDVLLKSKRHHYLRYNKRIQGISAQHDYQLGNNNFTSTVTTSQAKGRFASARIAAINGVQGPYKLRGNDGERFIIVLSNSEAVFVDGRKLKRGFNHDYIIDYNLGEITFNTNIPITQFTRIRIDFEYFQINYSRNLTTFTQYLKRKKSRYSFSWYQQRDNENRPLGFDISQQDLTSLIEAGDSEILASISGIDSLGFQENQIRYERFDTLYEGRIFQVLRLSQDPNRALYVAIFTEVGINKGNYRISDLTLNGKTYEWIAPINGVPQGNFEPIQVINTPKKNAMVVGSATWILDSTSNGYRSIQTEVAISNFDQNLYSPLDDGDNSGFASRINYQQTKNSFYKNYNLGLNANVEFLNTDFTWIERFRPVEFDRNWGINLPQDTARSDDIIGTLNIELEKSPTEYIKYKVSRRRKGESIRGTQQTFHFSNPIAKVLHLQGSSFIANNSTILNDSRWTRLTSEIKYTPFSIQPGYRFETDRNQIFQPTTDSVINTIMSFEQHTAFLETKTNKTTQLSANYSVRRDAIPKNGRMADSLVSQIASISINKGLTPENEFSLNISRRRQFDIDNEDSATSILLAKLYLAKTSKDRKNKIRFDFSTSEARELRREFVFFMVNTGQGTHTWRDENNDGVQDLNEFYEAINVDERNFVKIFVPTDEYTSVFESRYKLSFQYFPEFSGSKLARLFRVDGDANISERVSNSGLRKRFLPTFRLADENLLGTNKFLRSEIYFRKGKRGFSGSLMIKNTTRKDLLSEGFETKTSTLRGLNWRWATKKRLTFFGTLSRSIKSNASNVFLLKNYSIKETISSNTVSWLPTNKSRINLSYTSKIKGSDGSGSGLANQVGVEHQLRGKKGFQLSSKLDILNMQFNGEPNTPLAYEILEAQQEGTNTKWSIIASKKVIKGLQLLLKYDGRKPAGNEAIHLGTAQLTATF